MTESEPRGDLVREPGREVVLNRVLWVFTPHWVFSPLVVGGPGAEGAGNFWVFWRGSAVIFY